MANTSSHPWTVNGVRLDTWAYNIETKEGWLNAPAMRGGNVEIEGRHGELYTPNKPYDTGFVALNMWISSNDVDGVPIGTDRYFALRKNHDALLNLFNSSYGLLDVQHQIGPTPATDTRQAFCEVVAAIPATIRPSNSYAALKIGLSIPGVFWQDLATQDWSSTLGTGSVGTHSVTTMAGATAPMEDLQFQVIGPITNPRITDVRTGHYCQLNESVPSGSRWEVNASAGTSIVATNPNWTGVGTNKVQNTHSVGMLNPAMFALTPALVLGSSPSVQLGGTGASTSTRLIIRSRRKFK